jgi:hypothetical protein
MKERWDREDDARWRKRAAEIAAQVAKAQPWLAKMHEVEAEEERIRNWYLEELEKEEQDKQRRKKLRELTERINRDMVRAEREGLIRRGVYGGSGGSGVVKSTLL